MNGLAICAGVAGIDIGLSIVDPQYRTVCYVERESYAAAALATRMEQGALDPCPVWDDLATFNGRRWRGFVDIVHAGLPCQPYSLIGKQKGESDERYLWPEFFRVVDEISPSLVFLENVPNLLQWFRRIGEELFLLGYRFEVGIFSAAEIGASHQRERLFILAHRIGEGLEGHRWNGGNWNKSRWFEAEQIGSTTQSSIPFFPPGPASEDWPRIIELWPKLAPASVESKLRGLVDGIPAGMDVHIDRIRAGGNAVVPLQAAFAFITLAEKLGLKGTNVHSS